MTITKIDLTIPMKKMAKKVWPELEDLSFDEYEVKNFKVDCIKCGNTAINTGYRVQPNSEWKMRKDEVDCSDCQVREEMAQSSTSYRKSINKSITERWWHPPKGLEDENFKSFTTPNVATKNALSACVEYAKGFVEGDSENQHNLLLTGTTGTGKTHLSYSIAKYLRMKEIGSVGFTTTGKVLSMIKETYNKGASRTENGILYDLSKIDFLCLDDLGAEVKDRDEFSWARSMLFEIVNSRSGRPTVYTTNFDDKNLGKVVGERIASRLQHNTKYINLFTDDYRKKFKID